MNSSSGRLSVLADAGEVDGLAAGHAARAARQRQDPQHLELRAGAVREDVFGQNLKRQRLQRVAHQQRGGLVEFDVTGGLAATQDIVVHAGQVIVHQRIGVDHLDGGGHDFDPRRICRRQFARGESEQGPHALAAAEHGVAHGPVQPRGRDLRRRQETLQCRFHARLDRPHPGGKISRLVRHQERLAEYWPGVPALAAGPGLVWPGSTAQVPGRACAQRGTARGRVARIPCRRRVFPTRPMRLRN